MKILKTTLIIAITLITNNLFSQLTVTENHQNVHWYIYNSGSIYLTVTGGTTPYTFYWETNNGSGLVTTNQNQYNLTVGTYNCTITDAASNTETISINI